ncbi:MAG: histidinol phosphate phosphatase, partial [Gemmatimonadetes bacterium]|nr:histidinol phosphate phosphatase [Gemmatimonadota bacterium]
LCLIDGAAEAVRRTNDAGFLAVLVTNQPQVAKGFASREVIESIHARLETDLGRAGAKLDRIYWCPHHPEAGHEDEVTELKGACECRKPTPGLLVRAATDLNVDLGRSCIIGDSWRDFGAGRSMGVAVYGVRTGEGSRLLPPGIEPPDLIFDDVNEATAFVVHGVPEVEILATRLAQDAPSQRPKLVAVSGISRTGKSTVAHALRTALGRKGIETLHVRLDDWIVPRKERAPESTVAERTQSASMPEIARRLLGGETVEAPGYDPHDRRGGRIVRYTAPSRGVVILDGVLAGSSGLQHLIDALVYVEAADEIVEARTRAFYRWKGCPAGEIAATLRRRRSEEWPAVRKQRTGADLIVGSSDASRRV